MFLCSLCLWCCVSVFYCCFIAAFILPSCWKHAMQINVQRFQLTAFWQPFVFSIDINWAKAMGIYVVKANGIKTDRPSSSTLWAWSSDIDCDLKQSKSWFYWRELSPQVSHSPFGQYLLTEASWIPNIELSKMERRTKGWVDEHLFHCITCVLTFIWN